ncbi:MAG: DNA gyrase subunit A [Chloroflexi bacterium]|nr:DNA gyrase subunit A [Chloroflexota bacterium]
MVEASVDRIRPVRIEDEMRTAYLDYAMSVIVARALPDVRDGMKPVQRRILYAMHGMGLRPGSSHKKCAAVVGEVLGKYHPHGDAPVYDALVRMAQDFSMRHPLVDGQGNFGSVDDDPPAAMRYTEARLARIAEAMLTDIDRETVDFRDNYDGSQREPSVLPARLPNLLANGASGIAVGMATNIPPHNLNELCDAITYLIDHADATVDELMQFVKGPDFPTAGIIMGTEGIEQAYHTGHGRVVVRGRTSIEDVERGGHQRIVISELPFQVNKATMVAKIATLMKEKKIEGISEIRDESDRDGMRVVVELQRNTMPEQVLNNLYKHTTLQNAFHVNMVALVDGQPRVLSLKPALQHFIDFRRTVVRRRAEYDLTRARERAHVLEGLRVALENLDAVIALIRASKDAEAARNGLMERFGLTEVQAQAILEMQLRRLAALERERIENEYQELTKTIGGLEGLLADPAEVLEVIKTETAELRKTFGQGRRTKISAEEARDYSMEELVARGDAVVTLSDRGYLKRLPIEAYRLQHRGGKGVRGQQTREGDAIQQLIVCETHDWLLFFTDRGRVYRERVFNIGEDLTRQTRGTPLQNLIAINAAEESVTAIVAISDLTVDQYIFMATRKGAVKRMALSQFANIRRNGLAAFDLKKGDALLGARLADPDNTVIMVTRNGKAVHFELDEVRVRATRSAGGVRGIRLLDKDEVIGMDVATPGAQLLVLTERGYGKRTLVDHFRTTGRGVQGVIALKIMDKTGPLAAAVVTAEDVEEIMVGSAKAMVYRTSIKEIRTLGRNTQGVQVMNKLAPDDQVISMSAFKERSWEEEEAPEPPKPAAGKTAAKPAPKATKAADGGKATTAAKSAPKATKAADGGKATTASKTAPKASAAPKSAKATESGKTTKPAASPKAPTAPKSAKASTDGRKSASSQLKMELPPDEPASGKDGASGGRKKR